MNNFHIEYSIALSQMTAECVTLCTLAVINCKNRFPLPLFLLYHLPLADSMTIFSAMLLKHSRLKAITLV